MSVVSSGLAEARRLRQQQSAELSLQRTPPLLEVALVPAAAGEAQLRVLKALRELAPTMFLICCHPEATEDPRLRLSAFAAGANMVTASAAAVQRVLLLISETRMSGGISCAWCGLQGLTAEGYWTHQPLYHIYEPNIAGVCPVCTRRTSNVARHLHDCHAPPGHRHEERTGVFSLAVVRRPGDGKFLLTQEFAGQGYWVPGGGVDPGESLTAAAIRETREEAGADVALRGVLCCESHHQGAWRRAIFYAEPLEAAAAQPPQLPGRDKVGDGARAAAAAVAAASPRELYGGAVGGPRCSCSLPSPRDTPKTVPDFESAGACYVSLADLATVPVRSPAEMMWLWKVAEEGWRAPPLQILDEWREAFHDVPF